MAQASSTEASKVKDPGRFAALDGLRGVAAIIVVLHHIMISSPRILEISASGYDFPDRGIGWLLVFSPAHIIWAGNEAVYLFFILSGFVLTLPFLRPSVPRWRSYYPKRLIRLYLPVWGSLVLAVLLAQLIPRESVATYSGWINAHAAPETFVHDLWLLDGAGFLNSPLWSLRWEVLFSLLLPAFVLLAREFSRYWYVGLVGCFWLIAMAIKTPNEYMLYLPMFGIGVLLATGKGFLIKWGSLLGVPIWGKVVWWALVLAGLLLFPIAWYTPTASYSMLWELLGSVVLIVACLSFKPAMIIGASLPLRYLGTRSFSLYLVHEPIIVSAVNLFHLTNPAVIAAIAVPAIFVVAELFYRFVEKPSHKLANYVGRNLQRSPGRRRESPAYSEA